jgi:hypothetical protein
MESDLDNRSLRNAKVTANTEARSFALFENATVKTLQLGTRTPQRFGRSSTGSTQRH